MHIDRELIDPDADKVVRRLARHGYQAYLVGGCVRDLLLGRTPKDFDVATSATPKEIKQLFRNCRIIGRRFRLAHIFFGSKIIETSTFRANPRQGEEADESEELLIRRDNVFGTDTEDARRRDFTINGLFYDVEGEQVIDHVGGLADLEARLVSTIGDPDIRFREDPVRMLRAVKFAARLGLEIEPATRAALIRHRGELAKCAQPRVLEEVYRYLREGAARRSLELLIETGLAGVLSPQLVHLFGRSGAPLEPSPLDAVDDVPPPSDEEEEAWAAVWADGPRRRGTPSPAAPERGSNEVLASFLVAGDLDERRKLAGRMLDQLDRLSATRVEVSNSLLLCAVVAPFVVQDLLAPGLRPLEANALIEDVLLPLVQQTQVARKDAERCRQVLLAQRRVGPQRRRRGPGAAARRDVLEEALLLRELLGAAERGEAIDLSQWQSLPPAEVRSEGDEAVPGKRRRRRRGGRRRRRGGEDDLEEATPLH